MSDQPIQSVVVADLSVTQVLQHLRRRLWIIVFWALLAAVVAGVMTTALLPRQYTATTTLLVNSSALGQLPAAGVAQGLLSSLGAGGAAMSAFDLIGHAHSVLSSRTVRGNIVQQFQLKNRFGVATDWEARQALGGITTIQDDSKQRNLSISVTVKGSPWITDRGERADWANRTLAADVANAYGEELDKVDTLLFRTDAETRRDFLSHRLDEAQLTLTGAEDDLRDWQQANQVLAPGATASAMSTKLVELQVDRERALVAAAVAQRQLLTAQDELNSIAPQREASSMEVRNPLLDDLQKRLTEAQTQLALAIHVAGNSEKHPDVRRWRTEIETLTAELRRALQDALVTQERTTSASPAYDQVQNALLQAHLAKASAASEAAALAAAIDRVNSDVSRMPEDQTEYARRTRAVSIKEQVYQMLRMQYEQAVIDQHRAVDSFVVLDPAIPPEHKSSPHILTSTLAAFAAGFIFAALWVLYGIGAGQERKP